MPQEQSENLKPLDRPIEYFVEKGETVIVRRSVKNPDGSKSYRLEAGWRAHRFPEPGEVIVQNDKLSLSKSISLSEINADNNPYKSPQEWINFYRQAGVPEADYRHILGQLGVNTLDPRPISVEIAAAAAEKASFLPIEGTSVSDISAVLLENLKKSKVQKQLQPAKSAAPAPPTLVNHIERRIPPIEAAFSQMLKSKDLEHNLSSQAAALGDVCRDILARGGFPLIIGEQQFLYSIQPSQGDLQLKGQMLVPNEKIGPIISIQSHRPRRMLFYGELSHYGKLLERDVLGNAHELITWMKQNPNFSPRHYISNEVALKIHQLRDSPNSPDSQTLIRELLLDYTRFTADPEKAKEYIERLKIT